MAGQSLCHWGFLSKRCRASIKRTVPVNPRITTVWVMAPPGIKRTPLSRLLVVIPVAAKITSSVFTKSSRVRSCPGPSAPFSRPAPALRRWKAPARPADRLLGFHGGGSQNPFRRSSNAQHHVDARSSKAVATAGDTSPSEISWIRAPARLTSSMRCR